MPGRVVYKENAQVPVLVPLSVPYMWHGAERFNRRSIRELLGLGILTYPQVHRGRTRLAIVSTSLQYVVRQEN